MIKTLTLAGLAGALALALAARPAQAAGSVTCTVQSVYFQTPGTTVDTNLLSLGCSDGNFYQLFQSNPSIQSSVLPPACTADLDQIKSFEAIALAAKLEGGQVTIFYVTVPTCPGNMNTNVRIIGGMQLL